MPKNNQQGNVLPLVLVSIVGILAFIFISGTFSFKDSLFSNLFPKKSSFASSNVTASTASGYKLGVKFFAPGTHLNPDQGWAKAKEVADVAYIQRGWNDLLVENVSQDINPARANGLEIYLAFDPLCGDRTRVSATDPASANQSCDANTTPNPVKFQNTNVKPDFIQAVRNLAINQPKYLLIGLEMNTYKSTDRTDYNFFVNNIYPDAYKSIKEVSPNTLVAVSYVYLPENANALSEFVSEFTKSDSRLDYLAISLYPWAWTGINSFDQTKIPSDLFVQIMNNSGTNLPLFIAETGMISRTWAGTGFSIAGSPENQAAWIEVLKVNAEGARTAGKPISVINYVSLADVDCPQEFISNPIFGWYCFLGLLGPNGELRGAAPNDGFSSMKQWQTELKTPPNNSTPVPTSTAYPETSPTGNFIIGDINQNNRVDVFDFNLLITDFGKTDTVSLRSDLNRNNRVDVFDFNLLVGNFGKSN